MKRDVAWRSATTVAILVLGGVYPRRDEVARPSPLRGTRRLAMRVFFYSP